jgi:argininosuccinate lyase
MSKQQTWGGRFSTAPTDIMQEINESISFDRRLYRQDIAGSMAHCDMLVKTFIITEEEGQAIKKGLQQIQKEIEDNKFKFRRDLEDIHMNIENRLTEIIGDTAGKLHTARSRNDQVAVDFKLWIRDHIDHLAELFEQLLNVLQEKASRHQTTVMPGFTHLQAAQPITLALHLGAYIEMFKRDIGRLHDCRKRLNECPLGACALAGTTFPIDRKMTADTLGFDKPTKNTVDSVSDRDFAIEYLSALALAAVHLSRLGEELVLWSSYQFQFIKLSDGFTTGSSIMPQKKNPDAAELIRAKSGRIIGALNSLLIVMKGLPLAYSKDMQEDKLPVFKATDYISLSLKAMTGMIVDMAVNTEKMREAATIGFTDATYLAEWLVQNLNIPFRKAHHITGAIVKHAEEKQCMLSELTLEELKSFEVGITKEVYHILSSR